MARPEAAHRVKSYSSATGYVYQYYFYETQDVGKGSNAAKAYVYMVSRDRKKVFPVRVLVLRQAAKNWGETSGRTLNGTEEYAVAKMRLFQALDEMPDVESQTDLIVDETNLPELLESLDL